MSAPLGSHRQLAAEVRGLALTKVKAILSMDEDKMSRQERQIFEAVLLRLTPTLLPRLNEHTGEDGKDLFPIPILSNVPIDLSNQKDKPASETNTGSPRGNVS
jgi:hypothetical protein